jgi:hypothetical protein
VAPGADLKQDRTLLEQPWYAGNSPRSTLLELLVAMLGSNYSVPSATERRGKVLFPEYDLGSGGRRLS